MLEEVCNMLNIIIYLSIGLDMGGNRLGQTLSYLLFFLLVSLLPPRSRPTKPKVRREGKN